MTNIQYRIMLQLKSAEYDPKSCWDSLKPYIKPKFGADVEDETDTSYRVNFHSSVQPSEMRKTLAEAFKTIHGVYYADVLYRFPDEMFHDRFTIWSDGMCQEYSTRSVYIEDGEMQKIL